MKIRAIIVRRVLVLCVAFFWITLASADEVRFEIRADGLACPYCAFGIEKKFMKISGVSKFDIDLQKGLVFVNGDKGLTLKDDQLKTLFNDSGFTFRSFKKIETN